MRAMITHTTKRRWPKIALPLLLSLFLLTNVSFTLMAQTNSAGFPSIRPCISSGIPTKIEGCHETENESLFASHQINDLTIQSYSLDALDESLFKSSQAIGYATTGGVVLGDLDGDGDLDAVFANIEGDSAVWLNDGQGKFVEHSSIPSGLSLPYSSKHVPTLLGDLDGDGDLDLVIGGGSVASTWVNNGVGHFNQGMELGALNSCDAALGDLDRDGDLDIATAYVGGTVKLWENNGDGTFVDSDKSFTASACRVAIGDFDADSDLDLLTTQSNGVNLYDNNGTKNEFDFVLSPVSTSIPNIKPRGETILGYFNADEYLDIYLSNVGTKSSSNDDNAQLYLGSMSGTFVLSQTVDKGSSVEAAAGDIDNDGDLDLFIARLNAANLVYLNEGGTFITTTESLGTTHTYFVALGDLDGDGDLDALTANGNGQPNIVWENASNSLFMVEAPQLPASILQRDIRAVALGDVDNDGDLDAFIGKGKFGDTNILPSNNPPIHTVTNTIWINQGQGNFVESATSFIPDYTADVALGDLDGDSDLDAFVGNGGIHHNFFSDKGLNEPNKVYINQGISQNGEIGAFVATTQTLGNYMTSAVALGDLDGDGDLDAFTANGATNISGSPLENAQSANRVYLNNGQASFMDTGQLLGTSISYDIALGDMDGDGDLDAVVANGRLQKDSGITDSERANKLYYNDGHGHFTDSGQQIGLSDSYSVQLGDLDGDGDLDAFFGNFFGQTNNVWLNDGRGNMHIGAQLGTNWTSSVAIGDIDNDGDLDLFDSTYANNNGYAQTNIYLNDSTGTFTLFNAPAKTAAGHAVVAFGDIDNDGDLDLLEVVDYSGGGKSDFLRLHRNTKHNESLIGHNLNGLFVHRPIAPPITNFYVPSQIVTDTIIPISYALFNDEGYAIKQIHAEYSLNGGGEWFPAVATDETIITNLSTSSTGTEHIYYWDTFESQFFGQSDNVVFRIEAYAQTATPDIAGTYQYTDVNPFPIQRPYAAAASYPFRVRGTQVQVLKGANPVADAQVFRIPAGASTAQPISNSNGQPFTTDNQGYLRGRGELALGDQIFALVPISAPTWLPTNKVNLYLTNATPTEQGFVGETVTESGIQELVVTEDKKLAVFNLTVSLEWDARQDDVYMTALKFQLQRASDLLFDWSNGQMVIGDVHIYHNREMWEEADIRILASNRYRPNATKGGIVNTITTDPAISAITYGPGQLRMGATWSRSGEAADELSEDWARTLVHELGHYLLFMDDNYFGFDDAGNFITVDSCTGVMANPYRDNDDNGYDEFHSDTNWLTDCAQTASHLGTGRSDWATLTTFYPLQKPNNGIVAVSGPNGNPFSVTFEDMSSGAPATLEDQSFTLVQSGGGQYFAAASAQGFIVRQGDHIINLGNATQDQLLARGAQPGDQLCLQDLVNLDFGCKDITPTDSGELAINSLGRWQPDITIKPVNSTTVQISVMMGNPANDVYAQIYPSDGKPEAELLLTAVSNTEFTGQFELDNPTTSATVHIWGIDSASNKQFNTITDYELGGNPICWWIFTSGCNNGAPVLSADGRAVINGENLDFGENEFYVLQTASALPELPAWGTPVGQAYRLTKSAGAPAFEGLNIQLSYLLREVPRGAENDLLIYYYDEANPATGWQQLETQRADNTGLAVSTAVQDEGLYVVLAAIATPPLTTGWNLFAYPNVNERPVAEALVSLDAQVFGCDQYCYTSVLQYQNNAWLLYDQTVPAPYSTIVNTLNTLQPLNTYWIYATRPVNPLIKPRTADAQQNLELPPATYYGEVTASNGFDPQIGDVVEGRINGLLCGTGQVTDSAIGLMYVIQIKADNGDDCGAAAREIVFTVDGQTMPHTAVWDNSVACFHPLDFGETAPTACEPPVSFTSIYLPVIRQP